MKTIALLGLLAFVSTTECCDPGHAKYEEAYVKNSKIKLCEERGGIPITEHAVTDEGGHTYTKLVNCAFPCKDPKAERQ